jgi:4-hydroxybenzoate polyprenyltransferase
MLLALLRAARPHQWIKNAFVGAPLVFALRVSDREALLRTIVAVACFCVLSSAVYLVNDIVDVDKDRAHPVKRRRAIASGALTVGTARICAALFAVGALGVASRLSLDFLLVSAGYLGLNLVYSFSLKRIPFVDVVCISSGFVLRVVAGAAAIPVAPSPWLLVCTVLLASLLGFGKRAHELRVAGASGHQRPVLERYSLKTLRVLLVVLAMATVAAYTAYTQSEHALQFFGTHQLALTIPFVVFGIARFLWITGSKLDAESPTDSMLRDHLFVANLVLYAVAVVVILYFA